MAKRKKAKKTGSRRRSRRVSGIDKAGLTQAAMVVAGFAAGQLVSNAIDKMDKSGNLSKPVVKGAILVAAGQFLLPMLMKNNTGKQIGLGITVNGGAKLLSLLKIAGLGATQRVYLPAPGNGVNAMVSGNGIPATIGRATSVAYAS